MKRWQRALVVLAGLGVYVWGAGLAWEFANRFLFFGCIGTCDSGDEADVRLIPAEIILAGGFVIILVGGLVWIFGGSKGHDAEPPDFSDKFIP